METSKEIQLSRQQYDDLACFYDLLKSPEGIVEGFFLKPDRKKITHYYGDKDTFIRETAYFNSQGFTCYAGLQPRDPKLMGTGKAGRNEDVIALRVLYADLDPIRPDGLNATEEEKLLCHQASIAIQEEISKGLG